jgi:hypothetical protein
MALYGVRKMKDKWGENFIREKIEKMDEDTFKSYFQGEFPRLTDGVPCKHKGCLNHRLHPCEECGRIAGNDYLTKCYYEKLLEWERWSIKNG